MRPSHHLEKSFVIFTSLNIYLDFALRVRQNKFSFISHPPNQNYSDFLASNQRCKETKPNSEHIGKKGKKRLHVPVMSTAAFFAEVECVSINVYTLHVHKKFSRLS